MTDSGWPTIDYDAVHSSRAALSGKIATPSVLYTLPTDSSSPTQLMVGDVDGDGKNEMVFADTDFFRVYEGDILKKSVAQGTIAYRVNSLVDVNGDGALEIFGWNVSGGFGIIDVVTGNAIWTHDATLSSVSAQFGDVNGDGLLELVSSDYSAQRQMHLFNGQTGEEIWAVDISGTNYSRPLIADINDDGAMEIVFLAHLGAEQERVYALDNAGATLWTFDMPSKGYISPMFADFNNDGISEIVVGCDEVIYCLDSEGTEIWSYETGIDSYGIHYAFTTGGSFADINDDGIIEVVVGLTDLDHAGNGGLCALKGTDGTLLWKQTLTVNDLHEYTTPLPIADIDGDGNLEILWFYSQCDPPPTRIASYLYAYDGDGALKWSYAETLPSTYFFNVITADVDNDGYLEVVVPDYYKKTYAILEMPSTKGLVYTGNGEIHQVATSNISVTRSLIGDRLELDKLNG